jgi:hypothetical protein
MWDMFVSSPIVFLMMMISNLMTYKDEKGKGSQIICTYYAEQNIQHTIDAKIVQQIEK